MIRIASIEDTPEEAERLRALLERYFAERGGDFTLKTFDKPLPFLESYRPEYDIVFMDIELPQMNGMAVARKLRELDERCVLVFLTKMPQFAVKGYEVNALYYLVKPLDEKLFLAKMDDMLEAVERSDEAVLITSQGGAQRVLLRNISYIEVRSHTLYYHTVDGTLAATGALGDVEASLGPKGFLRCNKGYLVNVRYIAQVKGYDLMLETGEVLQISRLRKTAFMTELAEAVGGAR